MSTTNRSADPPAAAVLYAAKSTEDKRGSIPTQLEDGRALAGREGLEVVAEFTDEAASAYSGDRGPGLADAMAECERRGAHLIVQHSDRLARGSGRRGEAKHLVEYALWALKAGVEIRSVQDPQTFGDLLYAVVTGQRNHEDSRRKALAVRDGLRRTFELGEPGGGPAPDGYQVLRALDERGRVARTYRLDPERAPIVGLAFDLYEQGMGDPSVARELNRRDLRTKGGRPWERRRVQDALTNHFYAGRVTRDRGKPTEEVRPGSHPALIEPERFDRLLELRASRDRGGDKRPKRGAPARNHALAGLARCAACGGAMRPITSPYRRKDGSRRRTYQCANVHAATGLCHAPPVDAELVDAAVVNRLDGYLGDFEAWREEIESGRAGEVERVRGEVERAEAEAVHVSGLADRIAEDYERRLLADDERGADEAMRRLTQKREEIDRAEVRLSAARRALVDVESREVDADALLDFYNALARAVRGRLDGAGDSMLRVNDALRDTFERFDLETTSAGVVVRPVLAAAAVERIAADEWPHGLSVGGYPAERWQGATVVLGVEEGEGLAEAELRPADPPTHLAREVERIAPPLRPIEAEFASSQECLLVKPKRSAFAASQPYA